MHRQVAAASNSHGSRRLCEAGKRIKNPTRAQVSAPGAAFVSIGSTNSWHSAPDRSAHPTQNQSPPSLHVFFAWSNLVIPRLLPIGNLKGSLLRLNRAAFALRTSCCRKRRGATNWKTYDPRRSFPSPPFTCSSCSRRSSLSKRAAGLRRKLLLI